METVKLLSHRTLHDFNQIDLALEGDQRAFQALFKRYWQHLFFKVQKLIPDKEEARDVTMEAFSKALLNLHRFKKDYGFNTWLFRIAKNHTIDYLRKKRLPTIPLSTFAAGDTYEFSTRGNDQDCRYKNPEEQFMQGQEAYAIDVCLRALPPKFRDIARLRFSEACSYQEIALLLNMPLGTVKARIHQARKLLQQSLPYWQR
jgi:RNA polymerase sigma-70 factor (ECF subfamily)